MTIDLEKSTADGRRALRKARRRASMVVDQARAVEVPTMSDLGHRLDRVPAELEKAVDRQIRAAKRTGRRAQRRGLVPPIANSRGRHTAIRGTAIVVVLGA